MRHSNVARILGSSICLLFAVVSCSKEPPLQSAPTEVVQKGMEESFKHNMQYMKPGQRKRMEKLGTQFGSSPAPAGTAK